jgi:hypothetical protein
MVLLLRGNHFPHPLRKCFGLQAYKLWRTHGLGTTMPTEMTTSLKKNPSEDFAFPSLFLVFDAKEGEEDLYLFSI